jgi:hypothetical protein
VTTNLKTVTGATKDYPLAQRTLIVGSSTSGKSAVTQAVELAVSKRMTDFTGRENSSLRTVQDSVVVAGAQLVTVIAGEPGPLLYSETLESIQKSPLEAHVELLGGLLPAEARDMHAKLKSAERTKRDLAGQIVKLASAAEFVGQFLSGVTDPAAMPHTEALRESAAKSVVLLEGQMATLDAGIEGARNAIRLAVRLAWNEDVLAAINDYIPIKPYLGKLCVNADGFGLGLQRPNEPARFALSGSEFNIVVTAMACARASRFAENSAELPIIIPADRAIDPELLQGWMEVLSLAPAQILLTSTVMPAKVPKGWTVLNMNAAGSKKKLAVQTRAKTAKKGSKRK